ncbi:hypothetical protein L1049_022372 [Liquidambar formosana]|uniref:MULE transposase domain-containing protein n=1 Tax=Liquidambar formosana TaxID=63359 RepID=A0AAP0RED8_LIQFO
MDCQEIEELMNESLPQCEELQVMDMGNNEGHSVQNEALQLPVGNFESREDLLNIVRDFVVMQGHPSYRRFSKEEISRIKEMTMSGVAPCQILSSLRQSNPNLQAVSKSVYNMKAKIRKDYLSGRTMGEKECDYVWALEMFKKALVADCQPSVIVSDRELVSMKAIKVVFTTTANLLCVWHIEKNILTNCKKYFKEGEDWLAFLSAWTTVINSSNESKYNEALQLFELLYKEKEDALNYIKNTWLPYKTIMLVHELITHVSVLALNELFKQYELAKFNTDLSTCTRHFMTSMGLPSAHKIKNLKNKVLHLDDIHSQRRLDIRSFENAKAIQSNIEDQVKGMIEEFQHKYQEWPLDKKEAARKQIFQLINSPSPLLNEPHVHSHKGRPSSSTNKRGKSSTRRDPSAFEIVENMRQCSVCRGFGHNSRTCQRN